jgi:arabinan endo-1,5-alpha-L-arabinosidase
MLARTSTILGLLLLGLLVEASLSSATLEGQQASAYSLTGAFWATHDPSIIKQGKTWYVFSTGKAPTGGQLPIRCSEDLHLWRLCGQVFDKIPDWITRESPGTKDLWAPDISYFNGVYRIYYAYSLFGKNTSGIALATNKTLDPASPDYRWIDQGLVLRSQAQDDFNAIDPNFAVDAKGGTWLDFGSFWSGIKLVHLNPQTGKPSDNRMYPLATRKPPVNPPPAKPDGPLDWQAVEAPFIVHHGHYYYLFVSWDLCCRGTNSTYRIMVGRSSEITGPYVDRDGELMKEGGGTVVLTGNARWIGPGGQSVLLGHGKEPDILAFHAYAATTGKPALQISTLSWQDGWPHAALEDK